MGLFTKEQEQEENIVIPRCGYVTAVPSTGDVPEAKRYKKGRWCRNCRKQLSVYNSGRQCFSCKRG